MLIRSALLSGLGVPHAFTTREGGVSSAPFDSLNFGNPGDLPPERRDPRASILRNWELVLRELGLAGRGLVEVHQVHGGGVRVVRAGEALAAHDTGSIKADAIVTDSDGVVAVRVADCAPVLLSSADGRVVSAVHAGWRGAVAGVVANAVRAMRELGAREIYAAVGPCLSVEHFEVGPEVAEEFRRVFPERPPVREHPEKAGRWRLDLKGALSRQLESLGVARVEVLEGCTFGEPARFFSHRRDRGLTGRMIGVIAARRG
jgi:YfiH family protein